MRGTTVKGLLILFSAGLFALGSFSNAAAQQRKSFQNGTINRSVGLAASFQGRHTDILVPIWVAQRLAFVPYFSVINTENVGTNLGLGAMIRFYRRIARLSPYFGIKGRADVALPNGGGSAVDITAGGFFGGEFFINDQFSFGVEAHAQVFVPDVGARVFSTAAALIANIYF